MTTAITLLTQADCAMCDQAKAVLAKVAAEHPIAVDEIDLGSEHGRELALTAGVMFAPGVLINGEPFSYGRLSERKLRARLTRAGSTK
ncbi:glutaredoxin family protein [Catenulispora rubra]|uniref:glutaredoxin family protein n=1 Tax=Catenulispora rubra TaxID=280293 RepID=UPI00189281B7|nr:glutaredoxin family protein [Catenulispora rubra]